MGDFSVMLRFGRRGAGPQLPFSGRYLTRLFILTGGCVIAIIALNRPTSHQASRRKPEPEGAGFSGRPIQTALAPSPFGELGMGVIVSDDRPKKRDDIPECPSISDQLDSDTLEPVDQRLLRHVLDKTTDRSKRPFYHLITLSGRARPESLERNARRDITYAKLWTEPENYRGELIFLKGYLRGLHAWKPSDDPFFNSARFDMLYDGYLVTEDSRPNPYIIVVPRVSDAMPIGTNIAENVTCAGYFFKLWRYTAADGTERAAPLVVGQILTWTPTPQHPRTSRLASYLAAAFLVLVMSVGGAIWLLNRRHPRRVRFLAGSGATPESATLAGLAQLEKTDFADPITSLDQLSSPTHQKSEPHS